MLGFPFFKSNKSNRNGGVRETAAGQVGQEDSREAKKEEPLFLRSSFPGKCFPC